jgi:hypothetical protein
MLALTMAWLSEPGGGVAWADVVLDWNDLLLEAIRIDDSAPTLSTRNLAILHVAMFDAVNSVDRQFQPYQFLAEPPEGATAEAAAVGAAYLVASQLYPTLNSRADLLYAEYIGSQPATAVLTNSLSFGAEIGRRALAARSADGSTTQLPYIPSDLPGQWRRTPPFFRPPLDPHWRYVTPFCLPSVEPFVPPGPPPLTSAQYAQDYNEVKALGAANSTVRTPEQSQIAQFWSDFSYTAMPPGHWHEITAIIARNHTNNLVQNARLFALISLAQADAAIVCWEAKYRYNFWRPVTAIQRGDEDGNPATEPDPAWASWLNAPNFPEYISGHSTFSKATATVLTRFYGTDALPFTIGSDSLPGVYRSFTSVSDCAEEVGMSRIYGGIHFMTANRDGKACGEAVARFVLDNFLLSADAPPRLVLLSVNGEGVRLSLHGAEGRPCVILTSEDLIHWQPISTNAASRLGTIVVDADAKEMPRRFYRTFPQ